MKKKNEIYKNISNKNKIVSLLLPVLAILSAVLLYSFIRQYTTTFRNTFLSETQSFMEEIAEQVTLVVNDRVSSKIKNLETDAMAIAQFQINDYESITRFLKEEAVRYGYSGLVLAGTDGFALDKDGNHLNVSRRRHYLAALQGKAGISDLMVSDYNNTNSIEFAVPVFRGAEVKGVLLANYRLDDFKDIFSVNTFDGNGMATVISSQGVVIISTKTVSYYNFFTELTENFTVSGESYEKFAADIGQGASGSISFSDHNEAALLYYQPLGINDWSLLLTTPMDSISGKTSLMLEGLAYMGFFIAALFSSLALFVIITQRNNRRKLEYMLYVDPVTQGLSYAGFERAAKKILTTHERRYMVMQINIAKFRLINTTFGREQGNRLLLYMYECIADCLEDDELVTRQSADRFCLLLRYESGKETDRRINEFSEKINSYNLLRKDKYILEFNTGACIVDSSREDIYTFYERANFSRTHGGDDKSSEGKVPFYNELEKELLLREKELENRMEEALAQGEFHVYLQPKYELKNGTIAGAEALVRWIVPDKGMMSPAEFIPLFEKNGFIVQLDLYMFDRVCQIQQRRYENHLRCEPISVNLSRKHLEKLDFLQKYKDIYAKYSFPPELLEIELTESIVFDNVQFLIRLIEEIHTIGFTCSMDDFGSGYSSLNMLKEIPVDVLKLDRAFFYSAGGQQEKSQYVIENIIALAGKLNMKTVSEGIETIDQVEYLRTVNCDMVQGYVFAKPQPVSHFEELLEKEENEKNY